MLHKAQRYCSLFICSPPRASYLPAALMSALSSCCAKAAHAHAALTCGPFYSRVWALAFLSLMEFPTHRRGDGSFCLWFKVRSSICLYWAPRVAPVVSDVAGYLLLVSTLPPLSGVRELKDRSLRMGALPFAWAYGGLVGFVVLGHIFSLLPSHLDLSPRHLA